MENEPEIYLSQYNTMSDVIQYNIGNLIIDIPVCYYKYLVRAPSGHSLRGWILLDIYYYY